MKARQNDHDANRDPLSGEPGSHPFGVGVGAAGVGAAGAALGAAAGPVGAAVGAVVGAVAGGLAGKAIAESIDHATEDAYWRKHYSSRPYFKPGSSYDDYRPAFRYGWESHQRYPDRSWDDVEPELERDWNKNRGTSCLDWPEARMATRDAWGRIDQPVTTAPTDESKTGE
jgi:hypothetical protein